jgi:flagellin-like protein
MSTSIIHKRRAVSPVIATVILIAVAVALGIAVAFWASGLTSSFSKYEKLGVSTQYATVTSSSNCPYLPTGGVCWQINLGGQNTGSSDATITQIQVNGVPYVPSTSYKVSFSTPTNPSGSISGSSISIPVSSGQTFSISFYLPSSVSSGTPPVSGKTFADGQTIQVTLITAAGNNYPASIVLP